MFAASLVPQNFLGEKSWLVLAAGVAVAGLAFLVGYFVFLRRPMRLAHSGPAPRKADPFMYGSATERRESLRRKGSRVKTQVTDVDTGADLGAAWVIDRSLGGLCLVMEKPLRVAAVVNLQTIHAPSGSPWVAVEVKSCRQRDGEWEVGCQFVRRPSWSALLLFG
jgi:hypothetical protein